MIARLLPAGHSRPRAILSSRTWLVVLIVAGTLLASTLLAYRFPANRLTLALGGLLGVGAVLVFLRWPPLGLVIAIVAGMVLPIVGPNGLNAPMLLIALLFGLWVLDMVISRGKGRLAASRPMLPLLALVLIACLAFLFGQLPWFNFAQNAPLDAQLGGLSIYLLSAAAFVLVANQMRDLAWLKAMTWMFLAFGALFIIGRATSPLGRPLTALFQGQAIGGMFWAWLPAVALSQAFFNRDLSRPARMALLGLVAASFYVAFFQTYDWKSGWVTMLAVVGTLVILRNWQVGLILALIGAPVLFGLSQTVLATEDYSTSTRIEAWVILLEIVKISPILGLGFGNYYWYTPLFPIRGWYVRFNSHNNYVDIVAQMGLVGLASFLWFFVEIGRLGWRLRDRVTDGFSRAYVYGALAGAVGTLVAAMLGDWVLSFVYNIGLDGFKTGVVGWMFMGGLVAIEQLAAGRR